MITVLTGTNNYAVLAKLAEIKQVFISQYGEAGVEQYFAQQLDPDHLGGMLGGATLFASSRLVIIKDASTHKQLAEKLIEFFKTLSDQTHLVLLENNLDKRTAYYKALKKETDFHEFPELDENAAVQWVSNLVKDGGGAMGATDARKLVYAIGVDQSRLGHEIVKLLAYDKTITSQTIERLVEPDPRDTVFQLLEFALSGKTEKALEVLEGLERAHEDPFQTANMLVWQANVLAVVYSAGATSEAEVAKSAKINPFVVRKTKNLAHTIDKPQLRKILDSVAKCDITLKTTGGDPWRVIEQAILAFV